MMSIHRRRSNAGLAFFGLAIAAGAIGPCLAPADVFAQPRERTMYVSVLDRSEKPVQSVQPEDLVVREDGQAREILRVVPATADPLQIVLLVDNSQAATARIQRMREALTAFINRVANGTHEIAMVTLADRPTLRVDATTDAKALVKKGVEGLFAQQGSGMYLLDAITDSAKGFKKKEAARPVMIAIITEGIEFSQPHYESVLDALKSTGTMFYALVLTEGPEADPSSEEVRSRNVVIDRGTRETGGRRETIITDMSLQAELMTVADELLHQFKVTYARPERLIPPDKVTVEAKSADRTARGMLSGPRDARGSK